LGRQGEVKLTEFGKVAGDKLVSSALGQVVLDAHAVAVLFEADQDLGSILLSKDVVGFLVLNSFLPVGNSQLFGAFDQKLKIFLLQVFM
jgi:hypothetical protein